MALAILSSGCGGSGEAAASAATAAFEAETRSQTLGADGGSVSLTAADGTQYTLLVPAGALAASTTLSLTTAQPAGEQRFRVIAGPDGLVFKAGTAATLTIVLPAGRSLPTEGALTYNGAPVPLTRDADGALEFRLVQLRGSAAAVGLARPAAATSSASALVCRSPGLPADAATGVSSIDRRDLARYADCVLGQIEDLDAGGDFDTAIQLAMSMDELFQNAGMDNTPFLASARTSACAARQRAIDALQPIVVTDLGDILKIEKLAYWDMVMQKLGGAACAGQPDLASVVQPKVDDALALLADELPAFGSVAVNSEAYIALSDKARATIALRDKLLAMAAALGTPVAREAPSAARERPRGATLPYDGAAVATDSLQGQLEPAALANLLPAPWNGCRASGNYQPLTALMDLFGPAASIRQAAQYCGTRLAADVLDSASQLKSSVTGMGGIAAGQSRIDATMNVTNSDVLRLAGPITALGCPQGMAGSEALVLRFNGVEVQRISAAPYLANSLSLNIADLRAAADLAPDDTSVRNLVIEREGEACGGYWGATPQPLLSLRLSFSGPPRLAFWSTRTAAGEYLYDPATGLQILLAALDGSNIFLLERPSWSPDGRRMALASWDQPNNKSFIRIIQADGSGASNLTAPADSPTYFDASWSPDGTKIALTHTIASGSPNIVTLDADGTNQVALTQTAQGGGRAPSWSPDARRIVFERDGRLFLMNADGSAQAALGNATPAGESDGWPAWSPDGTRIAFIRSSVSGWAIMVVNADGTGQVRAYSVGISVIINGISWAPDSAQIAFGRGDTDAMVFSIYSVKPDGTGLTNLTNGTRDFYPGWSR